MCFHHSTLRATNVSSVVGDLACKPPTTECIFSSWRVNGEKHNSMWHSYPTPKVWTCFNNYCGRYTLKCRFCVENWSSRWDGITVVVTFTWFFRELSNFAMFSSLITKFGMHFLVHLTSARTKVCMLTLYCSCFLPSEKASYTFFFESLGVELNKCVCKHNFVSGSYSPHLSLYANIQEEICNSTWR